MLEEKMLPRPDVLRVIGLKSPSTLYELMRRQGFPEPYRVSEGRKCWAASEVQAWLRHRMAEQRGERRGGVAR